MPATVVDAVWRGVVIDRAVPVAGMARSYGVALRRWRECRAED